MNGSCPKCKSDEHSTTYVLIAVEHCPPCALYSQYRLPYLPFKGVFDMITRITTMVIEKETNLTGLRTVLTRQLAKVERRLTKGRNRNNGSLPEPERKGR